MEIREVYNNEKKKMRDSEWHKLWDEQKLKGDWGEERYYVMAQKQNWAVKDYRDYTKFKHMQQKGIDFGTIYNFGAKEKFTEVKTNLYYSTYNNTNDWVFNLCMKKWFGMENEKDGWFLTSQADTIYHWENGVRNSFVCYDLGIMRDYILKEWNRPTNNWIKDLTYKGSKKSDYALLLPICVNDDRFKPYIKQCNTNILIGEYGKNAKEKQGVYYTNRTSKMIKLNRKGKIVNER